MLALRPRPWLVTALGPAPAQAIFQFYLTLCYHPETREDIFNMNDIPM